jgi:hypothetical protein
MPLCKTIEEMKSKFGKLNVNASIESFASYLADAEEKYILPLIGQDMYDELVAWYDVVGTPAENVPLQKLHAQVLRALVYYALLESAPTMMLDFGDGGIMEGAPDGQSSARQWTVKGAVEYFSINADTFAESVLQFLEKNKADYETWDDSDSRKAARALFIPNGRAWKDAGADIDQPHRFFLRCYQSVKRTQEINILDIIGQELMDELVEQMKDGNVTGENETLISKILPVVAYYALADAIPTVAFSISSSGIRLLNENDGINVKQSVSDDLVATQTQRNINLGKRYEAILCNFLNDNATDYPLWPVPETSTAAGARKTLIDNYGKKSFQL